MEGLIVVDTDTPGTFAVPWKINPPASGGE
jgi:hypothetical protein